LFAFCTDGDLLEAEEADELSLRISGPFGQELSSTNNLVLDAANALKGAAGTVAGARLFLTKNLPIASGIGGGSADAAAALRLLTRLWKIDPSHAVSVAPGIGSDVPACLFSLTARGEGAGDKLQLIQDSSIPNTPILLVNPAVPISTGTVFAGWDGVDRGPLSDWREGRNDLEPSALSIAPVVSELLSWLGQQDGTNFVRMSGSGATCFALFDSEAQRDAAAETCPSNWWHLATFLR
jgi:4-diphosphocytidyl-2-C-methyl-D-erythritol kinase